MGTGGMRLGAGRPGYRAKAEQLHRLDIRDLRRRDLLRCRCSFTWSWQRGGEHSGSIGLQVQSDELLTLRYTLTQDGKARDVVERVTLARQACRYGGSRAWFQCPCCARSVAVLYLRWSRFACRHCQQVAYSSQSEDVMDRTWRKQVKIEARLGQHWQRPKGMRQRTYRRLKNILIDCEERRESAFCVAAARLLASMGRGAA